ncbi:MAG: hypothetical protein ACFFD2_00375 [Promethearchaeota archaeon]
MHLKSIKIWMIAYVALTLFDVIVTYIFISGPSFGIENEGNALIRNLMNRFGIWQGLTIYVLQEFAFTFLIWGAFYYIIKFLVKEKSEQLRYKVDIIIFNIGAPFIIMASALLHLFSGIIWLVLGFIGEIDMLKFVIYVIILCAIFQAYHVFKQCSFSPPEQSI